MGKKTQPKIIPELSGDIDANNGEMEAGQTLEERKKSKKSKKKNDVEDDLVKDVEEMTIKDDSKTSKKKLKDAVGKKEKNVTKAISVEADVESDSDDDFQPTVGGGFAALMDDFNDINESEESENDSPVSKPQLKEKSKKKENTGLLKQENGIPKEKTDNKKEKGKKSKSKRKGKDEEEDIEQLLLELESEYSGVKKPVSESKEDVKNVNDDDTINKKTSVATDTTSPASDNVDISVETSKLSSKKINRKEKIDLKTDDIVIASSSTDTMKDKKIQEISEKKEQGKTKLIEGDKEPNKAKNKKGKDVKDNENLMAEDKTSKKVKKEVKESSPALEVAKDDKKSKNETEEKETSPEGDAETDSKKKKKQKGKDDKKKKEEDTKGKKGKPNQKMIDAMKELLAKKKEEEERLQKEEEERIRLEDERIKQLEEQRRLEEERKERLKQKQKDRLKRLKEEGKLLTPKQKLDQKRAQVMLECLKAQGVAIPEAGEKVAPITHKKPKKKKLEDVPKEEEKEETATDVLGNEEDAIKEGTLVEAIEEVTLEDEGVAEAWDELSSASETEDNSVEDKIGSEKIKKQKKDNQVKEGSCSESEEDSDNGSDDHQTEAEKRKERAKARIELRKVENEKNRSEAILRSPVVCVLGHVDHGKTKILDKLRRTNVQEGEVGGITQQIGATNVPFDAIRSQTRMVKDFEADNVRLPGLLIIDTPGHESFSNLRNRGSSLCDIAILVVDITQGLEPQTIESINLLKTRKTPFVVALNKVDRVFEWDSNPNKDIREIIKLQNEPCKNDFERRTKEIIQALNNEGLNAALFWENPDPRSYCSLVPTSAISGDGMGNLMALVTSMCQKRLANRLMFSNELQCTVLEVKTIQGHGTTIDVILVNGKLREGDTLILAGTEGPIVTQLRSLLIPKPMKEIRVKGQYDELKEVQAALGVKIAAKELEKAIAGLNLQVAYHEDEVEILKEDVDREFKTAMRSMKVKDRGVYVQASTLGALEALLEFFKVNKVPYSGIRVGPVVKRDVMKAAAMLEHDPMYAVILAFDVKVERDAQELADKEGVKIFSEETIYHLGDRYVEYIKEYKKKKQDEFRHVAVFPSKLKIIPTAIFNKRDPIVLGVTVEAGILRTGTPLCVPSKEFVEIGIVTSLEFDHKVVDIAKKGVSVCMKVEPIPGHTPKLYGRHFEADDFLVSKISRESIDACKQYFRDDLGKLEWKLMAELKKQFGIL